ncbi:hypothetical protein B1A99_25835 [Cohnella sp. CIP 111063]|nr:hypothetical protein B1A99_25835 [Cohnella sp. CIP 111063]
MIHGSADQVKLHAFEQADQQRGITRSGDVQIVPVQTKLFCQWEQSISFLKMEIVPTFLEEVADESGFGETGELMLERKFLVQDKKLLQLGEWMLEELYNGGASGKLYRDSLANMTAVHLLQHYTTSSEKCIKLSKLTNQQITLVIEYMQAHLEKDMSLEELAAAANVSISHLVRLFKKQTGLTPHQYLIQLRIEQAKTLIRCGRLGMKEIAVQVGFADQGHFTKLFKRTTGLTPVQYAKR